MTRSTTLMKSLTAAETPAKKHPAPASLQPLTYDHARSMTAEFWHGIALGTVIGAGGVVALLAGIGRI